MLRRAAFYFEKKKVINKRCLLIKIKQIFEVKISVRTFIGKFFCLLCKPLYYFQCFTRRPTTRRAALTLLIQNTVCNRWSSKETTIDFQIFKSLRFKIWRISSILLNIYIHYLKTYA